MHLFALEMPLEFGISFLQMMSATVRPLIGIAMAGMVVLVFRPLLTGLLRAALLLLAPKKSLPERRASQKRSGVRLLHRMASDMEASQPNMAAELRSFATRN
jgi:hypothetical protein